MGEDIRHNRPVDPDDLRQQIPAWLAGDLGERALRAFEEGLAGEAALRDEVGGLAALRAQLGAESHDRLVGVLRDLADSLRFDVMQTIQASPREQRRVFARRELLELVRDYEALDQDEKTINVHVSHLREKLEDDPVDPTFILTVRGAGYAFAER